MAIAPKSALARARRCFRIEGEALTATARSLDREFVATARAVESTVAASGKLIFSGVGKSAHIAQKIAATFNSTGVASCFIDATQALHGDLGLCAEGDLAILLSNSGQSEEILRLVPLLKRFGLRVVAFTAQDDSDLARAADHRLLYRVPREACPLKLAPTASTTAAAKDSLYAIAKKYYGAATNARVQALIEANRDVLPAGAGTPLKEGMTLKIP